MNPMLPVYLDCPFSLPLRYSLTFICLVSCISYVASFFGFSFFINPSIFSNNYFFLCLMNLCCQFLWIVLICLVSCISYVVSLSGWSFFITPSVFSNMYLSCVFCFLYCQFICIVFFHYPFGILKHLFVLSLLYPMLPVFLDCPFSLPLRYSLTFICLVSCISYVTSFFGFSFFINPSIFSNNYFFLCLMNLCCQFLWIVLICLVSCISYVASLSGLLYIICCQFIWIVLLYFPFSIL